ncbi:MAG: hypothetical protein LOD89_06070, partial [Tissierellales bacterium]
RLLSQIKGDLTVRYGDEKKQKKEPQKIEVLVTENPTGGLNVSLIDYIPQGEDPYQFTKLDWIDYWAVGYIENNLFHAAAWEIRNYSNPSLSGNLVLQEISNRQPAVHIVDVLGNQVFYRISHS